MLLKSNEDSEIYIGKFFEKSKNIKPKERLKYRVNSGLIICFKFPLPFILFKFYRKQKEIINNYRAVAGDYVANLVEVFENNTYLILIIEHFDNHDLQSYFLQNWDDFTESIIKEIIGNCLRALEYIHSKGVLHNDINMSNILIDENNLSVKILDFKSSLVANKIKAKGNSLKSGNFYFKAPEIYETPHGEITGKIDIYSLGIIFLLMFVNNFIFS